MLNFCPPVLNPVSRKIFGLCTNAGFRRSSGYILKGDYTNNFYSLSPFPAYFSLVFSTKPSIFFYHYLNCAANKQKKETENDAVLKTRGGCHTWYPYHFFDRIRFIATYIKFWPFPPQSISFLTLFRPRIWAVRFEIHNATAPCMPPAVFAKTHPNLFLSIVSPLSAQ